MLAWMLSGCLKRNVLLFLSFLFLGFGFFLPQDVFAAAKTWDGGGGVDTNWSTCSNWDLNICPLSTDTVTFDVTAVTNSTIDASATGIVAGMTIAATYTGTITQSRSLTINGNYAQSAGTFTGGSADIDLNGDFTLSTITSATFTSTTGNLSISGAFTHTGGGTFTSGGTVTFDPATSKTINVTTTETFTHLTIAPSSVSVPVTISSGDTLIVTGTYTWNEGVINTGTVDARGTFAVGTGADGGSSTLTSTTGSVVTSTIAGGANIPIFTLANANQTVNFTGSGTVTFDAAVTLSAGTVDAVTLNTTFDTTVVISGGTFSAGTGTTTLSSTLNITSGIFNGNSSAVTHTGTVTMITTSTGTYNTSSGTTTVGSLTFTATGAECDCDNGLVRTAASSSRTWDVNSTETFNDVTFAPTGDLAPIVVGSGDTLIVNGTFTFSNGVLNTGTVDARGSFVVETGADGGSGTLTSTTGSAVTSTIAGGANIPIFTLANANQTVNFTGSGTVTFDAAVTLSAGTVDAVTLNTTFDVGVTISGGTFKAGTGTTLFTTTLALSSGAYNGNSATVTHTTTFTLSGGTYTASSGTTTFNGTYTHTAGGTFAHGSGTVVFTGGATTTNVTTTETFYHLTINKNNTITMTVSDSDTLVALGNLTLTNGAVNQAVKPATGTLEVQGNLTVGSGYDGGTSMLFFTAGNTQTIDATDATALFDGDVFINKTAGTAVNLLSDWTLNTSGQDLTIREGTFDVSGFALSVTGAGTETLIVEDGGNFQLQGGETVTTDSASYPDFQSGSTATYDGTSTLYTTKNFGDNYYHLVIAGGASSDFTLPANETIDGNLTLTTGILSQGGFTLTVTGTFSNNSTLRRFQNETLTLTMDVDSGTVEYVGDGDGSAESVTLTDFGTTDYYHLKINDVNATKDTFALGAATALAGNLTISSGTMSQGANTLSVTGNGVFDGGTFTGGSSAMSITGTFTLSAGTFTSTSNTLTLSSTYTHTGGGTFTHNSGTVTFTGSSSSIDVTTSETFSALTVNKTGGQTLTITSGDSLIAVGTLSLTDGIVDTGTLEPQGNVVVASTYDGGSSPLTFTGTAAQTFDLTGATDKWNANITINKTGETATLASALVMDSTGDLTVSQGGFSTGNFAFTTSGGSADVTVSGGTFSLGSSTVATDGAVTVSSGTLNANSATGTQSGTMALSGGAYNGGSSSLTFSGAVTVSGATYTGGTSTPTFSGGLTISSGTFTASSGITTISSTYTHTAGGTFTHNSGTVTFTGSSSSVDVATTETFSALTINKTDGQTLTIASGDTLSAVGLLTLTNGAVATGTLDAQGNVTVGSGYDGGSASLTFTGTAAQTFDLTGATGTFNANITVNKSSETVTLGSAIVLDSTGDLTLSQGTFSTGNYAFTQSGGSSDLLVSGGTFSAGSSTMSLDGALTISSGNYNGNSSTMTQSGTTTISGGTYTGGTSTPTFDGGIVISSGTFTASSGTTTITSTFTHTAGGTFTHNSGTVAFTGDAATINVATSETFGSLTMNKSDGQMLTISSGDSLIVTGTLTLTNGAVATGTLEAQGAVSVASGYDGGTAPLKFSGTAAQTFTLTGAEAVFNADIEVAKSSGTVTLGSALTMDASGQDLTVSSGGLNTSAISNYGLTVAGVATVSGGTLTLNASTVDLNGNLVISSGTFTAPSGTMTLAGDMTYSGGTFTHNSGTVTLDGTSQVLSGSITFRNLNKTVASAATLTFGASSTTTVTGTLNLQGATGQILSLRSSSSGTQATIVPSTVTSPSYLDVKDNAVTGTTITCLSSTQGCVNSGNNSGWTFSLTGGGPTPESLGGGAVDAVLTVVSPNGGEELIGGEEYQIYWSNTGRAIDYVNLFYSPDGGSNWRTIDELVVNQDTYTWTVPAITSDDVLIKVEATDTVEVYEDAMSEETFTITTEEIEEDDDTEDDVADDASDGTLSTEADIVDLSEVTTHALLKLPDDGDSETQVDSAVYYIDEDGYRHAFPNESVFTSWYDDFDDIQTIDPDVLADIPLGKNVTYHPGVYLVKFQSASETYAVAPGGVLRWISTEEIAIALYGSAWNTWVRDISDAFYFNYTFGEDITNAHAFNPEAVEQSVTHPGENF